MQKTLHFFIIVLLGTLLAGFYGILHDQVTFTISPEYYRLFKFEKLGLSDLPISNERLKVGIIGFMATWWIGFSFSIVYAFMSLFLDVNKVLSVSVKAIFIHLLITLLFGIIGFTYASLFLQPEEIDWNIPHATLNIQSFINVGTMHNFGYLGGFLGIVFGIYYQLRFSKKYIY